VILTIEAVAFRAAGGESSARFARICAESSRNLILTDKDFDKSSLHAPIELGIN
jgi:hypothetical protein